MWEINQWICLIWLLCSAIADVRKREISGRSLLIGSVLAMIYRIFAAPLDILVLVGGLGVGIFFLFLSWITREGIGYADSIGIMVLSIYLGGWEILYLLCCAFAFLFVTAMICFLNRKKAGIPFYPFLGLGYVMLLLKDVM